MDTFVDSSWYFHRFVDPHNDAAPYDVEKSNAWMPIDQYIGGIEHAVLHLIYARFFQKFLMDMGMANDPEPFPHLLNQGVITARPRPLSIGRRKASRRSDASPFRGCSACGGSARRTATSSTWASCTRAPPSRRS